MSSSDPVVFALHEGMRRFLTLVSGIRPDLHRYCARMTGSVADGEDIVQDTLARAYYALSEMEAVPNLHSSGATRMELDQYHCCCCSQLLLMIDQLLKMKVQLSMMTMTELQLMKTDSQLVMMERQWMMMGWQSMTMMT